MSEPKPLTGVAGVHLSSVGVRLADHPALSPGQRRYCHRVARAAAEAEQHRRRRDELRGELDRQAQAERRAAELRAERMAHARAHRPHRPPPARRPVCRGPRQRAHRRRRTTGPTRAGPDSSEPDAGHHAGTTAEALA